MKVARENIASIRRYHQSRPVVIRKPGCSGWEGVLINVRSSDRSGLFFGYFAADGTGFVPSQAVNLKYTPDEV